MSARRDTVRDLLRARSSPAHVVDGGLPRLVELWESFAGQVERGFTGGIEDWRNEVDRREILDAVLHVAGEDLRRAWRRRVRIADRRVRTQLAPTATCVWGAANAREHGWNAGRNWWYFARPVAGSPEWMAEFARAEA